MTVRPCDNECARSNEVGYDICQSCHKAIVIEEPTLKLADIQEARLRCSLYKETSCIGVDCIARVGNPCIYDNGTKSLTALEPLDYSQFISKE